MTAETNPTKFKVLIGILVALLLGLGAYTISLFKENKSNSSNLTKQMQEKQGIEDELENLIAKYDEVIENNELKDQDLLEARDRINTLLADVKKAELNEGLLKRYKAEINRLKTERDRLFKKADSLIAVNNQLLVERDSTNTVLSQTYKEKDSIALRNRSLSKTVERGAMMTATGLSANGVIVRKSGKIIDTKRASRANKIRTCFTLSPNPIAKKGDKLIYIQIIAPNKKTIGDKKTVTISDNDIVYSSKVKVFYENDELDVCSIVNASEEDLEKGNYTINVYDEIRRIASSTLDLK